MDWILVIWSGVWGGGEGEKGVGVGVELLLKVSIHPPLRYGSM